MTKATGAKKGASRASVVAARAEAAADLNIPVGDRTVVVGGVSYIAENAEKWDRAVNGMIGSEGTLVGGVGATASPQEKLSQYDKLGGYITVDGRKVKNGAFFDVKNDAAIAKPAPVFLFRVNGEMVEVAVGAELPVEVQASEIADKRKASKAAKGTKKPAKPSVEDEE